MKVFGPSGRQRACGSSTDPCRGLPGFRFSIAEPTFGDARGTGLSRCETNNRIIGKENSPSTIREGLGAWIVPFSDDHGYGNTSEPEGGCSEKSGKGMRCLDERLTLTLDHGVGLLLDDASA